MPNRRTAIAVIVTILVAGFLLSRCSNDPTQLASAPTSRPASASSTRSNPIIAQNTTAAPANPGTSPARIAVTHVYTLKVPAADIEATQTQHLAECARLGCVVINSRLDQTFAGRATASMSIRIVPESFPAFAGILTASPVTIITHSEASEDKGAAIADIDKRAEAKSALRDRLLAMLRETGGKTIADLLTVEHELTQVQGDIESSIAQRDYLRTITETVRVDVSYFAVPTAVAEPPAPGIFDSIQQAFADSARTLANAIIKVVILLVTLLPWLPFVSLAGWAGYRGIRRRSASRLSSSANDAAAS